MRDAALISTEGTTTAPINGTKAALDPTLVIRLRFVLTEPTTVGVSVTATVHLALGAIAAPQVLSWLNRPALVPVKPTLRMFNCVLPLLIMVMDWATALPTYMSP